MNGNTMIPYPTASIERYVTEVHMKPEDNPYTSQFEQSTGSRVESRGVVVRTRGDEESHEVVSKTNIMIYYK